MLMIEMMRGEFTYLVSSGRSTFHRRGTVGFDFMLRID
jgi:hypothetical protein